MKLVIGHWQYKAGFILTLLTLFFFCLFMSLGVWQLNRAEYKRTLHANFMERNSADALALDDISLEQEKTGNIIWQKVHSSGYFDEDRQILLDNQVLKSEAGYYVYTPFRPADMDKWILVNRGWIKSGIDRSTLPELIKTEIDIKIEGVLKEPPKTGIMLSDVDPERMSDQVIRVQKIDINQLEKLLNIKIMPLIIRLEPDSPYGYVRDWRIPGFGEEVHLGYAFQWFAFATTLLIIYLVLSVKKVSDVKDGTE